jgi:ribose/xylose/arabinose/galactoside ABC-type transport system permease subunit
MRAMIVDRPAPRSASVLVRLLPGGTVPTLSLVLLALVVVFGLLLGERIVGVGALQSMAFQLPELGILSLAMMVPLLSGGLNLSIIATANLCALTMAWVLTTYVPGAHGFMWGGWQVVAVLAGIAIATIVGLVNGFVIAYLGVSPILATLGTMTMCKGLAIGMTRGNVISGFPEPIVFLGNGTVAGVPVALAIFLALCVPMRCCSTRARSGTRST